MMLEYDAIGLRISSLSKMIYHIQEEEKKIAKLLSSYLKTIPEALILLTLPGVGTILCSRFLSGIGNIDRFSNSDALALYCGVACLDDTSGKRQGSKRASRAHYPINHVAKDAIMQIARCSIRVNPQSKTYYERKRNEGKKQWQSIKSLARNIIRVIYVMLKNKIKYEPIGHTQSKVQSSFQPQALAFSA